MTETLMDIDGWESPEDQHVFMHHRAKYLKYWRLNMQLQKKSSKHKEGRYLLPSSHKDNPKQFDQSHKTVERSNELPKIQKDYSSIMSINTISLDPSNKNRHRYLKVRKSSPLNSSQKSIDKQQKKDKQLKSPNEKRMKNRLSPIVVRKMYVQFKDRQQMNNIAERSLQNFLTQRQISGRKENKKVFDNPFHSIPY